MGRVSKILAIVVAAVVALFALAAIAFFLLFDPNDFREDIAAAVEERTGRELVIDGDVSLALFPWLAVEVGHARLGNAPDFGAEPFAEFDRARLSIRLMPLHPQRQRFDTAKRDIRIERTGDAARDRTHARQLRCQIRIAHDINTADHIRVTTDVLRARVHDQIAT